MMLRRLPRGAVVAAGVVVLEGLIRLVAGGPYPGATVLLLVACGIVLLPILPVQLASPSLRLAVAPALALASFAALLTTVSVVGIQLTELTIRLSVLALVVAVSLASALLREREPDAPNTSWSSKTEAVAVIVLVGTFAFALAASWDIAGSYPPPGADWGHYLLYADEVESQNRLLIDDPFAVEQGRLFADPAAVGAVYGSSRILDGISSARLASGLAVISALTVLGVYALAGGLWGVRAGLAASAAYAVSPIRLEPMYWHGLATTFALIFLPLVVLGLGLMFRGERDWRTSVLFGLSLVGVAVAHSTSAVVAAVLVGGALALDAVRWLVVRRSERSWWRCGAASPVLVGLAVAGVAGIGVGAHLRNQAADLGPPVSYRFFEPDWLDRHVLVDYYSIAFLALAAASTVLVLLSARLRRDPALLAVVGLVLTSVIVGHLWRLEIPFEYRRAVYYLGVGLAILIGVASAVVVRRRLVWGVGYLVVLAYIAHSAVGLRLPERLLSGPDERSLAVSGLEDFRQELGRQDVSESAVVVADRCLHFVVPYILRRPTLAAFEEWQVGFANRLPLARKATRVLEGGDEGRRLARSLGVRYVVVDPACTPEAEANVRGTTVVRNDELVILELPART